VKNRQRAGTEPTDNAADEDSGSADPLNGASGNEKLHRCRYTGAKRSKLRPEDAEEEKLQAVLKVGSDEEAKIVGPRQPAGWCEESGRRLKRRRRLDMSRLEQVR